MPSSAVRAVLRPRLSYSAGELAMHPPSRSFRHSGPQPSVSDWLPKRMSKGFSRTPTSLLQLPRREQFDIRLADAEFYSLSAFEQVRYAMNRPVPTTAPEVTDKRLRQILSKSPLSMILPSKEQREYQIAYHHERLEWLGDRIAYALAAEVLFALAPLEEKKPQGKPPLGQLSLELDRLVTNEMHANFSHEFGLSARVTSFNGSGSAADGWEAYLSALQISNGRRCLLEFYAPLIRREYLAKQFMRSFDRLPPVITASTTSLQALGVEEDGPTHTPSPPIFAKSYPKAPDTKSSSKSDKKASSAVITPAPAQKSIAEQIQAAPNLSPSPKKLSKMKKPNYPIEVPCSPDVLVQVLRSLDEKGIPFLLAFHSGTLMLTLPGHAPFVVSAKKRLQRRNLVSQKLVEKARAAGLLKILKLSPASAGARGDSDSRPSSASTGDSKAAVTPYSPAAKAGATTPQPPSLLEMAIKDGFEPLTFPTAEAARAGFQNALKKKGIPYSVHARKHLEALVIPGNKVSVKVTPRRPKQGEALEDYRFETLVKACVNIGYFRLETTEAAESKGGGLAKSTTTDTLPGQEAARAGSQAASSGQKTGL